MSVLVSLLNGDTLTTGTQTISGNKTFTGTTEVDTLNNGASGKAGVFQQFPATTSKGKTIFTTADNTGNTTTEIAVAAQAGARVYTVPDAGASASHVMTEGAQTVNGVKTFGSVPIGIGETIALSLPVMTALAGAAKTIFIAPYAGTIVNGRAGIDGAFITSDITIALRINTTAVTNGSMTLATAGSGFGTKATCTPSALNTFVAGDDINATLTGGVNAASGVVNVYVTRTS